MRSACLSGLVASLALAIACRATAVKPPVGESPYRTTSTVRDIMQSVVAPSAQGLWDSVGRISDARGTVDLEPKTDAEWAAVRRHAVALVESTNLLVIPGRHVAQATAETLKADDAEPGSELHPAEIEKRVAANWSAWVAMAHTLHDSATTMLEAVDKKDVASLETRGSDLDGVCESCHLVFWYPPRPTGAK
ncbi:MAG: hypothetical protein ABIX28_13315 [Vicinamibacterales bacterium]